MKVLALAALFLGVFAVWRLRPSLTVGTEPYDPLSLPIFDPRTWSTTVVSGPSTSSVFTAYPPVSSWSWTS